MGIFNPATGKESLYAWGLEKQNLGVSLGNLRFLKFDSADSRPVFGWNKSSTPIAAFGEQKGTPAGISAGGKPKLDLRAFEAAMALCSMYGAPVITPKGGGLTSVVVSAAGTGYLVNDPVTFTGGGGTGATGHVATVSGPGGILTVAIDNPGINYTSNPTAVFTAGAGTSGAGHGVVTNAAWLLQWYPHKLTDAQVFGLWEYFYYGADAVGAAIMNGRLASKIDFAVDANKRIKVDVDFAGGILGSQHMGFAVANSGNSGTYAGLWSWRGIRPHDSNYNSGYSYFLKVTAKDTTSVTFVSQFAAATPGDGTGFPGSGWGTPTFVVMAPNSNNNFDGYVKALDAAGAAIGQGGEDKHFLQLAIPSGFATFAVGDQFEFPVEMEALPATYVASNRFSAFHAEVTAGSRMVPFDKGKFNLTYAVKPYEASGSRYSQAMDRTGVPMVTMQYEERLFDSFIRNLQESNAVSSLYCTVRDDTPIPGTSQKEGIEVYLPQGRVTAANERSVSKPDTLLSTPTWEAEEPDTANPGPGSDFPGTHSIEINATLREDPTAFFATL